MARTKKMDDYKYPDNQNEPNKKKGIIIKSLMYHYRMSGQIGDVKEFDHKIFQELVNKKFIKPV